MLCLWMAVDVSDVLLRKPDFAAVEDGLANDESSSDLMARLLESSSRLIKKTALKFYSLAI